MNKNIQDFMNIYEHFDEIYEIPTQTFTEHHFFSKQTLVIK